MLSALTRDLLHAVRSLAKAPAFTAVCVVSLGIGMTPVIAIPYVSRVTSLVPLDVKTDGLIEVVTTSVGPHEARDVWSYPDAMDLRRAETGATLLPWAGAQSEVTLHPGDTATIKTSTIYVPAAYFKTIGVPLVRGAGFDGTADDALATTPAVIVGYSFWQNRLEADPEILGKTLTLDGVAHTITGVAPDQFSGHMALQGAELFAPLELHPNLRAGINTEKPDEEKNPRLDRTKEWMHIHGRLSSGVSVEQASAAIAGVTTRLAKDYPATNEYRAGAAKAYDPLGALTRSTFRMVQAVGLTLTGMVLLVVALNISGMMQVRSAMRERELSIRQAIGASRAQLARFLLAEAVVLAIAGGTLASIVLFNLPNLLMWLNGNPIPPIFAAQFDRALRIDLPIVAIAFGLCLLTSLVFGWLPAMRFSRPVILTSMKDDAGGGGLRVGRVHRVTAALQVAIAVPLLVMSGQSIDRVRATATQHLGFDSDLIYAAPLKLDGMNVATAGFETRRLRDALAQSDGVASVTVADGLPLDFRYRITDVALEVDANTAPRIVKAHVTRVGDGYLQTMGIPLLRGRAFTADDRAGAEPVTIVSKPLADKLAPDGDVVGRRLLFGPDPKARQTLTIVGVTADFPTSQMSTEREQLLMPLAQHPGVRSDSVQVVDDEGTPAQVMLVARSRAGEPEKKLTTALENVARELDPEFQPSGVVTGVWLRHKSMNDFLTQSTVAGVAGGVILLLAALGIYGVVGLMVATRTREIAVRSALGASRRRVITMIVRDVVKLVLPGVLGGMLLTVVLNRINAENMGLALSDLEPLAYIAGAAIAVLVAVLASLSPARRAASVDPMVAMRE